jgi:hypothetical protein
MVNGQWVVEAGIHPKEQETRNKFAQLLATLSAS